MSHLFPNTTLNRLSSLLGVDRRSRVSCSLFHSLRFERTTSRSSAFATLDLGHIFTVFSSLPSSYTCGDCDDCRPHVTILLHSTLHLSSPLLPLSASLAPSLSVCPSACVCLSSPPSPVQFSTCPVSQPASLPACQSDTYKLCSFPPQHQRLLLLLLGLGWGWGWLLYAAGRQITPSSHTSV